MESQRELLKLLKPKTGENMRDEYEDTTGRIRSFYTPTRSVKINSVLNNDPRTSRNICSHRAPIEAVTSLFVFL